MNINLFPFLNQSQICEKVNCLNLEFVKLGNDECMGILRVTQVLCFTSWSEDNAP